MNLRVLLSRNHFEYIVTVLAAWFCVNLYSRSPMLTVVGVCGVAAAMFIALKKSEYGLLVLAIVLPFRDIHLVSILHLKRFVIWSLLISGGSLARRLVPP